MSRRYNIVHYYEQQTTSQWDDKEAWASKMSEMLNLIAGYFIFVGSSQLSVYFIVGLSVVITSHANKQ